MPNELWGRMPVTGLVLPISPPVIALLLVCSVILAISFFKGGGFRALRAMTRVQWAVFIILAGGSLLFSRLLPLDMPWSHPLLSRYPPTATVALFSAVIYLIAAAVLNLPAALLIGLLAGLGRALGQTGSLLDVPAVGLVTVAAAASLNQNYSGRIFSHLRQPVVAGPLVRMLLALFIGLNVLLTVQPSAGFYAALDLALFVGGWSLVPLFIEGLVGGALVAAVFLIAPDWRRDPGEVPSPISRSLQRQLVSAFLSFAVAIVILSTVSAVFLSTRASERALAQQMIDSTDATAVRVGALHDELVSTLSAAGSDSELAQANESDKSAVLARIQAASPFSAIGLINAEGEVATGAASVAGRGALLELSPAEQAQITIARSEGRVRWIITREEGQPAIGLIVPGAAQSDEANVLFGRVAPAALAEVIGELPATGSYSLIVDERSQVLTAPRDFAATEWSPPQTAQRSGRLSALTGREVYEISDPASGARHMAYFTLAASGGWKVAAVTPYAAVLRQSLGIVWPFSILLLVFSGLFFAHVMALSRGITQPLADMSRASKAIAEGGGLDRPVRSEREDEIGQLSLAFSQMQRSLRQRLDELSLLLNVSNDVSATIDIDKGMTAVLQGVLRGTGATAVRAIVRNPGGSGPRIFAEGPAAGSVAPFDRPILLRLRYKSELVLATPAEIEAEIGRSLPQAAALYALPLMPAGEFQGVMYLVYRQPHYFDSSEQGLLKTLAGQATVLVQNAHLFAAAEGGRRRLAAILASTTNAVIVTDQTDRVLLVNPAMERAFGLQARTIAGKPVVDILSAAGASELARRLSLVHSASPDGPSSGKVEIEINERAYLAGISTVHSSAGQTMGRVAVLQDVTDIREVDRLKSDFLAGISHDLLSPLTYMHNYASMLPLIDSPELEQEYAAKILTGIDRMKHLVNDLLDLARIEAGLNLQFDRIEIDDLLSEVALEYVSLAKSAGIRLVVDRTKLPPLVGDPTLLSRAITNLVVNGLKYAPDSGDIVLRAEAVGDDIVISVRDHGPGITAQDHAHLFEKFYRGRR
ncbi:MAG TPA: histidine kinase dimerization/phospho-acceptor domain-containing protein, partial [Promineifilum sp.]